MYYHVPNMDHYRYLYDAPTMDYYERQPVYSPSLHELEPENNCNSFRNYNGFGNVMRKDFGPNPFVININQASKENDTYRTALWTGKHLQVTLMSLKPGEDIGLEIHPAVDQFLRIEQGHGVVQMGYSKNRLNFRRNVRDDSAIMIPAGIWHNVTNTGNIPMKLYSIYAPPNHPFGTVHVTKAAAMAAEEGHGHHR